MSVSPLPTTVSVAASNRQVLSVAEYFMVMFRHRYHLGSVILYEMSAQLQRMILIYGHL